MGDAVQGDSDPRRRAPSVAAMLDDPRLRESIGRLGRSIVKAAARSAQRAVRQGDLMPQEAVDALIAALPEQASSLRAVRNATGVIVHTNLGRAPLSRAAVDAMVAAAGYTDVELDLADGHRARRGRTTLSALRRAVPNAEAVHVVNNGAAALALTATALASGREILLSRGEFVEIGDGFRIPELLVSTGARIHEVGTTNRTRLEDYARAVGPQTGFILKIHPSNFTVRGLTSEVGLADLATLGVPVVADIGSGLLAPDALLPEEPDACTALENGASLVIASADKLLGGPQAGLILGAAAEVESLRRHPLARALRVDKLTLAALEATLAGPPTPVRQALQLPLAELRERSRLFAKSLNSRGIDAQVVPAEAVVGGGGAPGTVLPSCAIALPSHLARHLRTGTPPVVGRVMRDRLLLDLRCVPESDDDLVLAAVVKAAGA
ncbi:L-seryl-tRNA(Sec) selenium transferase [Streptomyces sp. NPDC058301]|uniref:L-seryl-tRNA(Sec) selenium transferase n=1 Tax=Streptomyces sp. NPDC058301 TaxID=3346436 RepID=UPI0036EF5363